MMRFVIDGQKLRLLGNPYIVGNSHDYLTASFQFFSDPDWEATEKHVFFKLGTNNPYEIILVDDTISKDKHLNLSDGIWSIYIIGYDINDGTLVERIPTNKVSLLVEESGIEEGEPFPDIGGSTGEQILVSEQDRRESELARKASEVLRLAAENIRAASEIGRITTEGARVASEQGRVTEEQNRVVAEQGRGTAEGLRVTAESGRDSAEQGRDTAEGLRDTAEQARDTAEDSRVIAESARAFYAAYDDTTSYILGNKVSYNGSSYIWTDDDPSVAGTQPPNTGWLLIASRGEDGTSGVYVGSDPIPEGHNVQIDPDGDATDVVLQFSTMPTADADYLGVTVLYTGATGTYKNGGTYICVASEDVVPVYSWSRVGEDVSGAISTHNTDAGAHADKQTKAITDTGNYFTTDTVDGALQTLGANVTLDANITFTAESGALSTALAPYASASWQHAVLDVFAGEVYSLTCSGANDQYRPVFLRNSTTGVNNYPIDVGIVTLNNTEIIIPAGYNKMYVNCYSPTVPFASFNIHLKKRLVMADVDASIKTLMKVDAAANLVQIDDEYETTQLQRRVLRKEKSNDFAWAAFDMPYFVFINDDSVRQEYINVFAANAVPMSVAIIPANITTSNLALLQSVVTNGGEVLGHYDASPTDASTDALWLTCTRDVKRSIEAWGFTVRGLIRANSTGAGTVKGEKYCRLYFDYANDQMGISTQYNIPRSLNLGTSIETFEAIIDTAALTNGIHAFGFHDATRDPYLTAAAMDTIIKYIKAKGNCQFTTFAYLFDTFGSSVLLERLKLLEV